MLSLESPRWEELTHAYGFASDIPALIKQLASFPNSEGQAEPWFSLWSALAHQGNVYPASFAAVPHVLAIFSEAPDNAPADFLHFPAWVEICRQKTGVPIPEDLFIDYEAAVAAIPTLVERASHRVWSNDLLLAALSALAVSKGNASLASAILELTPETLEEFNVWWESR